jgi:hypothetical protein
MTPEQLATLKTELNTDPNSYNYAQYLGEAFNPPALAAMLNLRRVAIQVVRNDVTAPELISVIQVDEFIVKENQTVLMGSWLESFLQRDPGMILNTDGTDGIIMYNLLKVLRNSQPSETRVRALGKRDGSRAEQIFNVGIAISFQDVIDAVRS